MMLDAGCLERSSDVIDRLRVLFQGRLRREAGVLAGWTAFRKAGVRWRDRPYVEGAKPRVAVKGCAFIGRGLVTRGVEARAAIVVHEGGRLTLGKGSLLNSGSSIEVTEAVTIGANFRLASFAYISDSDYHEVIPGQGVRVSPIFIGDDVWIGRGAVVLPGVTIGSGSVIGAGAVVTRSVPARSVAVGNPARVVRSYVDNGHFRK